MTYWFKMSVETDKNWTCETATCILDIDNFHPIKVSSYDWRYNLDGDALWSRKDVDKIRLNLSSDGYDSEDAANRAAQRLCNALVLSAGNGMPFDPGFVQLLQGGKPWVVGQGNLKKRRSGYSGGGITRNILTIGDEIARHSEHPECTIEQLRACATICNSVIPNGLRTSLDFGYSLFMARVSALEALAPNVEKNERIRRLLDETISELESKEYLTDDDRAELKRTLGNAKQESIAAKCKVFIRDHENTPKLSTASEGTSQYGIPAETRFRIMYNMRSAFTHGSQGPQEGILTVEDHDSARQCGFDAEEMIKLYLPLPD